jgi:multiple sugar transport system permease protein
LEPPALTVADTVRPDRRIRPRLPRLTYWQRDAATGYGFVGPQVAGFSVFVLGPIVAVGWFALHEWNLIFGAPRFAGLANFQHMLVDADIGQVALNSTLFAVGYVPLNVALGLAFALAVHRATRAVAFFRTLYFAPVVVSLVAWTIVWRFLLQDDGMVNGLLRLTGIDGPNWLRDPDTALAMVVLVQVLKTAGFSMVLFLAALQAVPRELEEAARLDGANGWALFRRITLPLIAPFVFLVTVLSVITSLKSFALIYLLTGGGPGKATMVLAYYIYEQGFRRFEFGYASALALVLFAVVILLTAGQFALRKRWVYSEA